MSTRGTFYNESHVLKYGTKIVDQHATKKHVVGAQSYMCITSGKEVTNAHQKAGSKRKNPAPTKDVKGWTGLSFRLLNYKSHVSVGFHTSGPSTAPPSMRQRRRYSMCSRRSSTRSPVTSAVPFRLCSRYIFL
uniref:Uncharacterized protein n=1 Tax=Peronospora matthiolae TaxID=2874970 RepID=A0AAV1UK98_9STRA